MYYGNHQSVQETYRKIRDFFGAYKRPSLQAIHDLIKKFEETGSVHDKPHPGRPKAENFAENIAVINESVETDRATSVRRRSQLLCISPTSLWRILHKNLHLHAYKIQLTQELKETDHGQRREFVAWMLKQRTINPGFVGKIIFSDEAHFTLNGTVNKQNSRVWGEENPRIILTHALHAQKCTVWCALWSGGIVGPFFFEDHCGKPVTVNSMRYNAMLKDFLWPQLDGIDHSDVYFQQDGATSHTTRENISLLRTKFPGRVISRNGDINWPPRSCDLTPLDFFLWGYLKGRVFINKPATIADLKENIRAAVREIDIKVIEKVLRNFDNRIDVCHHSCGGHLNDIIFHI